MKIENNFGYCEYDFERDSIGEYVHIFNLYVYPDFRKRGNAKMLLNEAIKAIRNTGYSGEIQIVAIPTENSISKENLKMFYKSLGLKVFEQYCKI